MRKTSSLILTILSACVVITTTARAEPISIYTGNGVGDGYDWISGWANGENWAPIHTSADLWFFDPKEGGPLQFQMRLETEFAPVDEVPERLWSELVAGNTLGGGTHYQFSQIACGELVCEFNTPFTLDGNVTAGLWPEDQTGWMSVYATANGIAHINGVSGSVYENESTFFGETFHRTLAGVTVNGYVAAGNFRVVPEPATLAFLGIGALTAFFERRRRNHDRQMFERRPALG